VDEHFQDDLDLNEAIDPISHGDFTPAVANLNDIKVEHHPAANREPDLYSFETFCSQPEGKEHNYQDVLASFSQRTPWSPFPTRLDFELAELMLDAHMTGGQIDRNISLFRQVLPDPDNSDLFTLTNGSDLARIWEAARSSRATGVCILHYLSPLINNNEARSHIDISSS
jgi:hypothetical protein